VLLVTTDSGAALFSGVDFESVPRIHLKPWSRVVCDMSTTHGVEASLSGVVTERSRVQMSYTCKLDGNGHGVFDKVMPGQYSVLRSDPTKNMGRDRAPVGNVTAVPGQSVQVSVQAGRKVVLRVTVPDEAKPWLAKRPDGMAFELQAAGGAADASRSERSTIWVHPDVSGRVETNETAPGAYVLKAEPLFDPGLPGGSVIKRYFTTEEIRFAVRPSKPGDDAPVDLGILEMHAEGEDATPSAAGAARPGFVVDKLEGGTLSLQDLCGRYVLIDFWAVWCKLCLAQEPNLKKVWQDFGKRDDFVMLGLCLGDDPKLIREFVSSHEISWPQGMLADGFSNVVAEHYGVTSLPHILLIGPDGKVVADNLLDDKIESVVRAALSPARPQP
jgi:peroxiredoxin